MKEKICKICNKEFIAQFNNTKYCSLICKEVAKEVTKKRFHEKNKGYMTIKMREYRKAQADN